MPTPEARAEFTVIQRLGDALRDLQELLVERLRYAPTVDDLVAVRDLLESIRGVSAIYFASMRQRPIATLRRCATPWRADRPY